jgi:hypothetical protein
VPERQRAVPSCVQWGVAMFDQKGISPRALPFCLHLRPSAFLFSRGKCATTPLRPLPPKTHSPGGCIDRRPVNEYMMLY